MFIVIVCESLYRESCSSGVSSEKHVEQYSMKEELPKSVGLVLVVFARWSGVS
jgi:hypothetical protein